MFGISYHIYRGSHTGQVTKAITDCYVRAYADVPVAKTAEQAFRGIWVEAPRQIRDVRDTAQAFARQGEANGISGWEEFGDEEV
ncbi:hypothetical protein VMCG_08674 [Cytospora schulzeri]|uniref:Uncharacterized protein n=1 Tax=Cytospora schulzeri TaxID=448051 RepID=A0A423VTP0_9PEZI|nr:hypothetical protein VMCG_08674 [Valsa malicola]